jgi:hypothetical protein
VRDPRLPSVPDPDDPGELPEIFAQLTAIDVVDGELIPRDATPQSG